MNNVNLQIYSFGFDCGLSFLDKIRKAGELGYAGVELVRDYEGIPAQDVVNALKEAGIPAVSAHVGLDFIEQDLPYLAELGVKYVACPMAAFNTAEEAKELAADLNRLGKLAKEYGITIGYHNHTGEFYVDQGKYLLDWVMENTDPQLVAFEIDCGWASAAGVNPVEYIQQHAGRICAIHVKENNAVIGAAPVPARPCPASQVRAGRERQAHHPAGIQADDGGAGKAERAHGHGHCRLEGRKGRRGRPVGRRSPVCGGAGSQLRRQGPRHLPDRGPGLAERKPVTLQDKRLPVSEAGSLFASLPNVGIFWRGRNICLSPATNRCKRKEGGS